MVMFLVQTVKNRVSCEVMGLGDEVSSKDQKGGFVFIASAVSCSICLEAVTDSDDRSIAKLQCGHEFHLGGASCQASFRGNCREDGDQLREVFWGPKKSGVFWIYKEIFHSERFTSLHLLRTTPPFHRFQSQSFVESEVLHSTSINKQVLDLEKSLQQSRASSGSFTFKSGTLLVRFI